MKKVACIIFEFEGDSEKTIEQIISRLEARATSVRTITPEFMEKITTGGNWTEKMSNILNVLGVDSSTVSCQALRDTMVVFSEHPEYLKHFKLKDIVREVQRKENIPYSVFERRIRTVIDWVYSNNPKEYVNNVLNIKNENVKITATKFLSFLATAVFN